MWVDKLMVRVALLLSVLKTSAAVHVKDCRMAEPGVYVAVSSEAKKDGNNKTIRWIQVHWHYIMDAKKGDFVGLWNKNPSDSLDSPLYQNPASGTDGIYRTIEEWDGSLVPTSVDEVMDSCLPYWAGYVRDGALLYSSCLMIRPRWMEEQKAGLSNTRLNKVAIPGTHDAGAAGYFTNSLIEDVVGRWTFTQDERLWDQLVFGVRYVDIRIAYYNNTKEKLFVNHGEVSIAPLQTYIDDVVSFMTQTNEIVIFDIHGLQHGFEEFPERHEKLIEVLETNFAEWIVPNSLYPDPIMEELWGTGARLIVTYPSPEGSQSMYLWPSVYHLWGDVNNLKDLKSFMYNGIPQQVDRGSLWSAMTEFTPTVLDISVDRWGGLRGAAAVTNTPVTQWFRHDWWDQVNIISMDFFLSSDVISVAVKANQLRSKCAGS